MVLFGGSGGDRWLDGGGVKYLERVDNTLFEGGTEFGGVGVRVVVGDKGK